jgi:hypothetical protein
MKFEIYLLTISSILAHPLSSINPLELREVFHHDRLGLRRAPPQRNVVKGEGVATAMPVRAAIKLISSV